MKHLLAQSSGHNLELMLFKTMEMIEGVPQQAHLLPSPSDTSSVFDSYSVKHGIHEHYIHLLNCKHGSHNIQI